MSVEQHDETTHAKPRPSDKRKGLLADRFRPGPLVEHDAIRTSHEALDEADGSKVVVHFLSERFAATSPMRRETVARLLDRVGRGNSYVSPLVEAGIERDRVFVVEPRASGVSLRSVLRGRAKTRKPLEARELLPVVARVRAALDALPKDIVVGRIAPRTVYVDPDGLRLTECFILSALDRRALVSLLREDEDLRASLAPECVRGVLTRAMDAFAVGALLHEALTFTPISGDGAVSLGPLERDVRALLGAEPSARPDLEQLVARLAELAHMRAPELDAQPFELEPATRAARLAALDAALDEDVEQLDDDDDVVIREEDKTRQIAMPQAGPVIDDLAMKAGEGRLPAPAITIEAAPVHVVRADAPKAPPPTRRSRPERADPSQPRLPAPNRSEPPPGPGAAVVKPRVEPPPEPPRRAPSVDHAPSVEISLTPVPPRGPRGDATDRVRDGKRVGETTQKLRAIEDPSARATSPTPERASRNRGPRLVLVAMIVSALLLAAMLAFAFVRKQEEEATRRELIERRLQQIREE